MLLSDLTASCLLICDLSASSITFKAHQVQLALVPCGDNRVHPAVWIIQRVLESACVVCPPFGTGTFKKQIQISQKNWAYCTLITLNELEKLKIFKRNIPKSSKSEVIRQAIFKNSKPAAVIAPLGILLPLFHLFLNLFSASVCQIYSHFIVSNSQNNS